MTHREIHVDRDRCIGSAQCIWYAPHTFDTGDDTVAVVIDQHGDPEEQIQTAIASCPARAIAVVERP